jgi:flagellar basal-body rod protein FlgB
MSVTDVPLFSMLRARMHWHQERQRLLAENVSNADMPKYRPRDLVPLQLGRTQTSVAGLSLSRTESGHLAGSAPGRAGGYEARRSDNAVNLEDEMIKVAANQMDYQAATTLYARSLALIKTAVGKR